MQHQNEPKCTTCDSPMVKGFLADRGHNDRQSVARWVEGEPRRSLMGISTEHQPKFELTAFRCTQCGRVDFFALAPTTAN